MKRDVNNNQFNSSFLACEKDIEIILKKLFVESSYKEFLKRLLVINTKDCLENQTDAVKEALNKASLAYLIQEGYIKLDPRLELDDHAEIKTYIIMSMAAFEPNSTNPQFRDCIVTFDIICNTKYWNIGNYRIRPIKIAGYIDGILNGAKLTGIGTFNFLGCEEKVWNEDWAQFELSYLAIHGSDDRIPPEED